MLAALSPDMLATDLAYYLARKGVCTPIFEWVTPRPDCAVKIWKRSFRSENASNADYFGVVFEEALVGEITWLRLRSRDVIVFSKYFPSALKCKTGIFTFLRFEELPVRSVEITPSFKFLRVCVVRVLDLSVLETWPISRRISPMTRTFQDRREPAWCTCERHNFRVRWFVLYWTMRNIANHIFRFHSVKLMVCPVLQFMLRKPKAVHWTNSLWRTWSKSGELHGLKFSLLHAIHLL